MGRNQVYDAHPIQKLRENLDKYPRTFDSCFLSYWWIPHLVAIDSHHAGINTAESPRVLVQYSVTLQADKKFLSE